MKCTAVYIYIYGLFNDTVVVQSIQYRLIGEIMCNELHKMLKGRNTAINWETSLFVTYRAVSAFYLRWKETNFNFFCICTSTEIYNQQVSFSSENYFKICNS
jgi:hypothetical protein